MRNGHLALALLLLAACGRQAADSSEAADDTQAAAEVASNAANLLEEAPLPPPPTNPSAGEAGRDDYTWTQFRSGGAAGFPVLIYGARGSDESVINLQCQEAGEVTVLQMRGALGEARGEPILLASGTQRLRLEVTLGPDSGDGNTPAAATVPLNQALLAAFRASGKLVVTNDGRARAADAVDSTERATIARFFDTCGA